MQWAPHFHYRIRAEQSRGADALQLTLRFSFRARLRRSVRPHESLQRRDNVTEKTDGRER